jgi:Zn-dependent M16 (insulinase) family peptidase
MSYVTLKFNVSNLNVSEILHLPIFTRALTSLGTTLKSLAQWDEQVRLHTGGIQVGCYSVPSVNDIMKQETFVTVQSNCSAENIQTMYDLVKETLLATNWSAKSDLKTCLLSEATEMANSCVDNGHLYAMKSSGSLLTPSSKLTELLSGMNQVGFLDQLVKENNIEILSSRLKQLSDKIFQGNPSVMVVCEESAQATHQELLSNLFPSTSSTESNVPVVNHLENREITQDHPMPIGINFTSRSFLGVHYTHPDAPLLKVRN